VESANVSLRQELGRTKDALNKERMARQQLQQEAQTIKEQYARLEQLRDNLDREVKTIPALTESNEILKADLNSVRRRFKEEKASLTKHIKHLESQSKDLEHVKGEVRTMAMRLMEISSNTPLGSSALPGATSASSYQQPSSSTRQQYDPQQSLMSVQSAISHAGNYRSTAPTHHISSMHHLDEDDDEDSNSREDGENQYLMDNENSDYEHNSFLEENASITSSVDSLPVGSMLMNSSNNHAAGQQLHHSSSAQKSSSSGKKKKVKKGTVTSTRSSNQHQQQQQQQVHMMQAMNSNHGMTTSFSLPRI
jgi:hypothetical protein